MSPVFAMKQRDEIKTKLLETGITLIQKKGIRKMTIDEVTTQVGIGKGTFYHFYDSKELYVYDVIQFSKESIYKTLNQLIETNGGIDRDALKELLHQFSFQGSNNIISSITAEDEAWLSAKLPPEYVLNAPKEEALVSLLLQHMIHTRSDIQPLVLANMMKIMAITVENRALLHQEVLQENLNLMFNQICEYIFED